MNKILSIIFVSLVTVTMSFAQTVWRNPLASTSPSYLQNQGWNEDGGNYHRLPNRAEGKVRDKVWQLACQSAGLSIRFKTDAPEISVKYTVTQPLNMPHMPSTGVSGVDLYRRNDQSFCFGNYSFGDTIRYHYKVDKGVKGKKEVEYELFLPLYNEVSHLEVGVPAKSSFSFVPAVKENAIVLYGTSIAQGACASRPGMAWANIVHRTLDRPLINLGFSGNGKLESEVVNFICEQRPSLVILDCMPNMGAIDSGEIIKRLKETIYRLRKTNVAILIVEHAGNSNGLTYQAEGEKSARCNRAQQQAYAQLQKEGVKNLFYLSQAELNLHPDSWVDYVHPSDFGMMQYATAMSRKIKDIMERKTK